MKTLARYLVAALACVASMATAPAVLAQSTEFTYQGVLEQAGAPVNGTADFEFMLFGTPTGGSIVSGSQVRSGVPIENGRFTVTLNFGSAALTGEARWLEIWVRSPGGTGADVMLTPRQRITPVPYAHRVVGVDGHSLDAADGDPANVLVVGNTGWVGIGDNAFDRFFVRTSNNSRFRVDSINGDVRLDPWLDTAGIWNDSTGPGARTEIIVANWPQVAITGGNGVGIGTVTPTRRLTVADNNLWTARFSSSASNYTAVDFVSDTPNQYASWTLGIMGSVAGGNAGALYLFPSSASTGSMILQTNNWVGLGKGPGFRLDLPNLANGDGRARANQWPIFSSARWKENVRTLDGALEKVMSLRGVTFDWKPEHGGTHDLGFVAEEVGKVVPELVTWEADGEHAQGLAYDHVTALAIEAVKAQQQKIERLRTANARAEDQIAQLRRLLAAEQE